MSPESQILTTLSQYGYAHDEQDFSLLRACLTEDAQYTMIAPGGSSIGPVSGADRIVEQIASFKVTQVGKRRHVISNPAFLELTETTAVVRSYLTTTATFDGVTTVVTAGVYLDRFRWSRGSWLIAEKHLTLDRHI